MVFPRSVKVAFVLVLVVLARSIFTNTVVQLRGYDSFGLYYKFLINFSRLKVISTNLSFYFRVFWKHMTGESCLQEDHDKKDKVLKSNHKEESSR